MNNDLNTWLAQKSDLPAVVAAAIIHGDKTAFSQSFSPELGETALEKIWPIVVDMTEVSKRQNFPNGRWTWNFSGFSIHSTFRTDGALLATITSRRLSTEQSGVLDHLLSEFRRL